MLGLWASKRGEPFLCLHAEPCANFRDATVHQDPKRWACGRRYEANPSSVCTMRHVPTSGMRLYTRIPSAGLVGVDTRRTLPLSRWRDFSAPDGCVWNHAAPSSDGSKPQYCTAPDGCSWDHAVPLLYGSKQRYGHANLWDHAASRMQVTLSQRQRPLHSLKTRSSWDVAPCCCIHCCRWCC